MQFGHNFHQLAICFDQFCNVLLGLVLCPGEKSWADETLSSRSWRWHASGKRSWPKKLIEGIFFWEPNHCYESFESERLGRQLPPEARMIEKTATSYSEFLDETAVRLKEKLHCGKISQEDYDKAMQHIREEQQAQALTQDS